MLHFKLCSKIYIHTDMSNKTDLLLLKIGWVMRLCY